jgi:hypothetical protein
MNMSAYKIESSQPIVSTLLRAGVRSGALLANRELAVALAAKFRAEVAGPEALGLHLVLQGLDELLAPQGAMGGHAQVAEGFDLLAHEVLDPVELLLEFRIGLEVPGHVVPPMRRRAA